MELKLQPLRISEGWTVTFNSGLYEVDPSPDLVAQEDRWWIFKQNMMQMKHERNNRLLDLGFSPEGDLENGAYDLVVFEGDWHGKLLYEFHTRDRLKLVSEIERVLNDVTWGKL